MDTKCKTLLEAVGVDNKPSSLKSSVLVLIDMQNEYLPSGNVPLIGVESALNEGSKLLNRARKHNAPIVHVVHHGPKGSGFYDPDGPGGQLNENVKPENGENIVIKHHISAFIDTNMKEILESTGRKDLIVIGFMTHMCLSTFVRAAAEQYGYRCTVVSNCTGTRDLPSKTKEGSVISAKEVQEGNLSALADYFACVVEKVEEILDE
jgi:nicotinamidase-related amidase